MRTRVPLVISALFFAALTLFSYQLFGWRLDGWILAGAGIVHLAVVLSSYPRLDPFLIGIHYVVTVVSLGGVVWILLDVAGSAAGAGSVFWALFQDQWSQIASYMILGLYVVLVTALFLILIVAISWLLRQRFPYRHEILEGLFVASLLNISCDFALVDPLSQVAVLRPEESQAFVFAVGIRSLVLPVILHGLVALTVGALWHGGDLRAEEASIDRR